MKTRSTRWTPSQKTGSDQEAWDSDGEPLINPENPAEPHFNFDPDAPEIEEHDAVALLALGPMYRDSRKALQAT